MKAKSLCLIVSFVLLTSCGKKERENLNIKNNNTYSAVKTSVDYSKLYEDSKKAEYDKIHEMAEELNYKSSYTDVVNVFGANEAAYQTDSVSYYCSFEYYSVYGTIAGGKTILMICDKEAETEEPLIFIPMEGMDKIIKIKELPKEGLTIEELVSAIGEYSSYDGERYFWEISDYYSVYARPGEMGLYVYYIEESGEYPLIDGLSVAQSLFEECQNGKGLQYFYEKLGEPDVVEAVGTKTKYIWKIENNRFTIEEDSCGEIVPSYGG